MPPLITNFLAWFGLLGGVWLLFVIPEETLPDMTKKSISDWLKRVRPSPGMKQWPEWFAEAFDRIFGDRHFSIRCFVMSCIVSSGWSFILVLFWMANGVDINISNIPVVTFFW